MGGGQGEKWDASLVGEPTNPEQLGDMIKIGRRGSLSGVITVMGRQGHAAYPHLADNPVRGIVTLVEALLSPPFDEGTADFQPTNLEVTSIDVGNPATNVIAAKATAAFNIRFNDTWTAETIQAEIHNRLDRAAGRRKLRPGNEEPIEFELVWRDRPSPVFLTRNDRLIETLIRFGQGCDRQGAGALDIGRNIRCALHQGLLSGRGVRAGGSDNAHG